MGKKATAKDVKKDAKVTGVKAETPKPVENKTVVPKKVKAETPKPVENKTVVPKKVKAETPKPVEVQETSIKEGGVKAETPKPVEVQVAESMEMAKELVTTPSVPQEAVKVENAGSLEDVIKADRGKAKEASPVVPTTPAPTATVPETVKARSAAAAKSYAAKRLAMAMLTSKRGWKETKPGIFEKDAHSVSFHTEGHHVEVDGKLQLALGQGAIKVLDKYLEADTPQTTV